MINYVVADIRIGTPGPRYLSSERRAFQDKVVKLLLRGGKVNRVAHPHSFSYSYSQLDQNAGHIQALLDQALGILAARFSEKVDALLVDFTWSPPDLVRDPILILLAEKVVEFFKAGRINTCMVLLPFTQQLTTESLIVKRFDQLLTEAPKSRVVILALDGKPVFCPSEVSTRPDIKEKYALLAKAIQKDPLQELEKKVVRRLGRFRSSRRPNASRIFSYLIDNCDAELLALLHRWWREKHPKCNAILYDTGNLPSMTNAVKTFAERHKLPYARVTDVMEGLQLLVNVASPKRCCLILDVVETGDTFLAHKKALEGMGWHISPEVVAGINRGGGKERKLQGHTLSCFLPVDPDPERAIQLQDSLDLPFSGHGPENFDQLRSFDMWYMAHESDWEREKDVPENIGFSYKIVPIFPRMLELYGDYVAYKMHDVLQQNGLPLDFFIIHPRESGAESVSDKLRTRLDPRVVVVRVPRHYIKKAQAKNDDWEQVKKHIDPTKEEWYYRLTHMGKASAIITDVFNASGSTFRSLHALLKSLGIPCFCYFPFVDRDGFDAKPEKYPVKCFCLYSWYGPRKVRKKV